MHITYVFDPLCGWCYGAGPAIERLSQLGGIALELAPSGLFAGDGARPMDAGFADYAWQNDQRIKRLTGQPFTEAYRNRVLGEVGGIFDSAPATVGIVAVGLTEPLRELEALKALQRARYVNGLNSSSLDTVAEVLEAAGLSEAARRVRSPDDELLSSYRRRIDGARAAMAEFGARGVPALIVGDDETRRILSSDALFGSFEQLTAQLRIA